MLKGLSLILVIIAASTMGGKGVRQYYWRRHMRNYSDPALLLGSSEDLILMMVSQHLWVEQNWWCMISKYVCTEVNGTVYQRRRYYWIPPSKYIFNTTIPNEKKRGSLLYRYEIQRHKGEFTKLNTTFYTGTQWYYEGLFPVFYADDICMIVGLSRPEYYLGRKPPCALWIVRSALEKPKGYCIFILLAICRSPMYNLREYEKTKCDEWGSPFVENSTSLADDDD
uniref:Putative secreted protein n=1 Tax=Amblyomma parvum TaxID=251391 RepID=A0A023FVX2_AMBPA